jgi:PAS domain S-box-containing protein
MRDRDTQTRVALRASLLYAFLAGVWIVFSGLTLAAFGHDVATIEKLVICESGVFVAVTASLLYRTLRRQMRMIKKEVEARQQAEARMRESEERFSMIFHSSPVGITLSRLSDRRLVDVNSAFLNMVGCSREDSIDRTPLEAGVWISPEDRDMLMEGIRRQGRAEGIEPGFVRNRVRKALCWAPRE